MAFFETFYEPGRRLFYHYTKATTEAAEMPAIVLPLLACYRPLLLYTWAWLVMVFFTHWSLACIWLSLPLEPGWRLGFPHMGSHLSYRLLLNPWALTRLILLLPPS